MIQEPKIPIKIVARNLWSLSALQHKNEKLLDKFNKEIVQ